MKLWKKSKIKKTQIDAIRMGKVKNYLQIDDILKILNKKTKEN